MSKCFECIHCTVYPGKYDGPMYECYPDETECTADSSNFMSDDGCYMYEYDYDK